MHFSCYSLRSQIKTVHLQCISSVILSTARWYQCICYASLLLFFQETDEDNAFAIHFTCYSSKNQIRPMQLLCISSAILAKVTLSHKYGIFCSSSPRASQFLPRRYKKIQIRPGNRYALLLLSYKRERERERLRQKKKKHHCSKSAWVSQFLFQTWRVFRIVYVIVRILFSLCNLFLLQRRNVETTSINSTSSGIYSHETTTWYQHGV